MTSYRRQPESIVHGFRHIGASAPTAIPASAPTHCKCGCGTELEQTRRVGGFAKGHLPPSTITRRAVAGLYKLVRYFERKRHGRVEKLALIECSCADKSRRTLPQRTWRNHPPKCCNKCRLREIDVHGFEAKHG